MSNGLMIRSQTECGTPKPKPRQGHGTLYLLWNGYTKPCDIPAVDQAARDFGMTIMGADGDLTNPRDAQVDEAAKMAGLRARNDPPGFLMYKSSANAVYNKIGLFDETLVNMRYMRQGGTMGNCTMDIFPKSDLYCDARPHCLWHGEFLVAQAKTPLGLEVLRRIALKTAPGKAVLIEHTETTLQLDKGLTLCVFTELGDDSIKEVDRNQLLFGDMSGHADFKRELATRFSRQIRLNID